MAAHTPSARVSQSGERLPGLQTAQCSLCGIALPTGLMVPDGGPACADVRWYCKDAKSCTQRWTTRAPIVAIKQSSGTGEPAPEAEERVSGIEEPRSAEAAEAVTVTPET